METAINGLFINHNYFSLARKICSFFVILVLIVSLCNSFAYADVGGICAEGVDNFSHSYSLVGDGPSDIVSVARAQIGRTNSTMQYHSGGWCAAFVNDCAYLAGQSGAIPFASGFTHDVGWLRAYILNSGGVEVSSPQAGDIVFYYCTNEQRYCHVGIMENGSSSIQGNVNNSVLRLDSVYYYNDEHGKCYTVSYVRPNYINQAPVITSAIITNRTSRGYDVTVSATGGSGIQTIGFYTWHSAMSLDDADKHYVQAANGKASFHVNFSVFNNPSNVQYYTNVEAFDTSNNASEIKRAVVVADLGNDFYATIKQDSSGGYLQNNGSKIITGLFPKTVGGDVKKAVWHFRKQLDGDYIGSYEISSEGNGGCIDVESYGVFDGNGINLLESVGNLAQRFYICLDEQKSYNRYFFNTVLATSSLDVPGAYTSLGGTVQLWRTNFTDAQMFVISPAKWTIVFDANGGTNAPASQSKNYKTPIKLPLSTPVRNHYRFLGWAESSTAKVAKYAPGVSYSQEGDIRLYAVWERIVENVLTLPASTTVIGDEAFLNTDADAIVVPGSVRQIGKNAFRDVVIYGVAGSVAETYANANGLTFVPVNSN